MKLQIRPVTPELWPALEDLFGRPGASNGCWCMYWRIGGRYRHRLRKENRAALRRSVKHGPPPGLLAFDGALASAGASSRRAALSRGWIGTAAWPASATNRFGRSPASTCVAAIGGKASARRSLRRRSQQRGERALSLSRPTLPKPRAPSRVTPRPSRASASSRLRAASSGDRSWSFGSRQHSELTAARVMRRGKSGLDDLRRRSIALGGSGRGVFDVLFEPGGGHRPYFLTKPAALWLHERLRFPRWSAEAIAKLPTTQIGGWARRHGVPIDRLYATELREGGTEALGAGIPAVAHDLLDALPRDRWDRERDQ